MAEPIAPVADEVTLADLVRVLWRRRWVLGALFLTVVAGSVAYVVLKPAEYTSDARIIAVEQQDVIQRWLDSRPAALWVAQRLGDPFLSQLFPGDWSPATASWRTARPSDERIGTAMAGLVEVASVPRTTQFNDRTVTVTVTFTDPLLARDAANAYVSSLDVIRPVLQNVTESQLFQQFYDGQNGPEARRQAHAVALERQYWLVLDPAAAATKPSAPNVRLDLALGLVLGAMVGVLGAFAAEWVAAYRLSSRPPTVPEAPPPSATGGPGSFRYRGR